MVGVDLTTPALPLDIVALIEPASMDLFRQAYASTINVLQAYFAVLLVTVALHHKVSDYWPCL